jgi:hypothetical protein
MKQNAKLPLHQAQSRLTRKLPAVAFAVFISVISVAAGQPALAQSVSPTVFQAAGPSPASIQSTVDQFRAALGAVNNANNPGQPSGRREINWDGGSPTNAATTLTGTPLTTFLNTRGANITTLGSGFVQAPASGLAATFGNPTYANIFQAFSPLRLFSPIGSNVTDIRFFVPGSNGGTRATSTGFGVVLSDVDSPDGGGLGLRTGNFFPSTLIEYFGVHGELLYFSNAPASPGNGNLSFFGVVFSDARVARVRIIAGNALPGRNDGRRIDVVMMDDFLYGEPTPF